MSRFSSLQSDRWVRAVVFHAVLFVLLPSGVAQQVAPAQGDVEQPAGTKASESDGDTQEPAKQEAKSDAETFSEALDEFEKEITDLERLGRYGDKEVERYVVELEQEYRTNAKLLSGRGGIETIPGAAMDEKLARRQQHIALLLWQLERVGSQLVQPGNSSTSMVTKVHRLLSEHREAMKDAGLMRRFHDLSRRASELSRRHLSSQMTNNFFFAHPQERSEVAAEPSRSSPSVAGRLLGLQTGQLQTVSDSIGKLVKLSWSDGKLVWDEEHWKQPFVGQTLQSIDSQVTEELTRRGLQLPEEDRMVAFRKKRLFETPQPMLLFQDFQHVASEGKHATRSFSTVGSAGQSRFTVSGIEAAFAIDANRTELSVREEAGPARTLQIRKQADGSLRLSLIGDHILLLEQSAEGAVRWVDIMEAAAGNDVTVLQADSFAELYGKHADLLESRLFPRLEHCGVGTPKQRYDPELVTRALERIRGVDAATRERFEALVIQIDSGNFSQRQNAYREISQNIEAFSMLLAELDEKGGWSAEASTRLGELQKQYSHSFETVDAVLSQAGWLEDPTYLVGLLSHVEADQTELVTRRLERLTGQQFGADVDRWKEWIAAEVK